MKEKKFAILFAGIVAAEQLSLRKQGKGKDFDVDKDLKTCIEFQVNAGRKGTYR